MQYSHIRKYVRYLLDLVHINKRGKVQWFEIRIGIFLWIMNNFIYKVFYYMTLNMI